MLPPQLTEQNRRAGSWKSLSTGQVAWTHDFLADSPTGAALVDNTATTEQLASKNVRQ